MQVQVVAEVDGPRARHPGLERPVAELEGSVQISFPTSHCQPLALHGQHRRHGGLVAEFLGQ